MMTTGNLQFSSMSIEPRTTPSTWSTANTLAALENLNVTMVKEDECMGEWMNELKSKMSSPLSTK